MSVAGLAVWAGCSSSSSGGGDSNTVDPGGTYGAEISVKVVGRGSVASKVAGINCPGSCFARYAFKSPADVGGTTGVTLTATVTSDKVRFVGWTLEPTPLSTRGRGPDNCNPVTRDSAIPAIDPSASDVTLPFGTVQGRPPAGQEGACGGFTDVPTSYSLTATFEDIPIPDAGVDADDGGGPDLYYDRPVVTGGIVGDAVGKEIGIPSGSSSYLYWRWQNGAGLSGISRGYTSSNLSPAQVVVQPTTVINLFSVDYHVVYQTADGTLHVIQAGGNLPVDIVGAPTCVGVSSDSSYVYCRTSTGSLYRWTTSGLSQTVLFTGLPTGSDVWADPNSTNIYLTDTTNSAIVYTSSSTADGGTPTFTTLASSQTNPSGLRGNYYRLFWLQTQVGGAAVYTSSTKTSGTNQAAPLTSGVDRVAAYVNDSSYVYFATTNEIDRAYYYGSTITPLRSDINKIGGLAVDTSYVYWTAGDGRVFRRYRN